MNVTLKEWNKLIEYGNELCKDLKNMGYDVRLKPYTMYDGRKGLYFQLFDSFGNFFKEYASGIDTFKNMKRSMYINMNRIVMEN